MKREVLDWRIKACAVSGTLEIVWDVRKAEKGGGAG
jgi:hypothetical protein